MAPRPKTPLWRAIAETLRDDISAGRYPEGRKLPTEAALAARFGVNRHTVRQGLALLAEEGLVHARRGSGVTVTARPADYAISKRVRFHQNIAATGKVPGRRFLQVETRGATAEEAEALGLEAGAMIHVHDGISTADGLPIALFRSHFPADRFADLPRQLTTSGSVTRALAASGLADYTRASTRISARAARAEQALLLRLPEGAPLVFSQAVNVDDAGAAVEWGLTWFAGERVTLTFATEG